MQSYRKVIVQDILEEVPVKRMMYTDVPVVSAELSVARLVDDYIMKSDNRAFIVFDGEKMLGLVTIEDVRKTAQEARSLTLVKDVMTPSQTK